MNKPIKLVTDTIDNKDIDSLINWLRTYPRLTKGELTIKFEKKWSEWLGKKYSIFCNSGSSANLLMLWALYESHRIPRNSKIVVPSASWATDLAPVIQLGMQPILCDANLDNLSVDLNHLEKIFKEENPGVLLLVSVLGIVPDMDNIINLCNQYGVILLEDTCESLGSKYKNNKLGTLGLMSSFSTYFGHHISTIEGGVISTDDEELYNILKCIRSHGWDRDLDSQEQTKLRNQWKTSEFDALYTFYYSGFNLRSTDLQAFIGLEQLNKLNDICKKRENNFQLYQKEIKNDYWKPKPMENTFISSMAYPLIHPYRNKIVKILKDNKVEVRPMICGSMGTQPFYVEQFGKKELPKASIIDKFGFYIPNHPSLTENEIIFICNLINKITNNAKNI